MSSKPRASNGQQRGPPRPSSLSPIASGAIQRKRAAPDTLSRWKRKTHLPFLEPEAISFSRSRRRLSLTSLLFFQKIYFFFFFLFSFFLFSAANCQLFRRLTDANHTKKPSNHTKKPSSSYKKTLFIIQKNPHLFLHILTFG